MIMFLDRRVRLQLGTGVALLASTFVCLAGAVPVMGQWPQWGGPTRDFKCEASGLTSEWPRKEGPPKLWTREIGDGYSGISVDDGIVYTLYRKDNDEIVIALSAETGETIWEHQYAAPGMPGASTQFGTGPQGSPLLDETHVYTVGLGAKMLCLDKKTGESVWEHDLNGEFGVSKLQFGYSCSPLAYKDTVIVTVGGKGKSVVAFNRSDGSVAWKNQDFEISYASPVIIDVDGQEQMIVFAAKKVAGMDPNDGTLFWEHPHETNYDVHASTPVWGDDNLLFVSSAYDTGSRVLKLTRAGDKTQVQELWATRKMQLHYSNAIRVGDYVYGSSGQNTAFFMAVNVHTGKTKWKKRKVAKKAQCILAGGKMIILDEDGKLVLATVTPEGVTIHAKHNLLESNSWTGPTLAGTTLFVRDRKKIIAVDLSVVPKPEEAS